MNATFALLCFMGIYNDETIARVPSELSTFGEAIDGLHNCYKFKSPETQSQTVLCMPAQFLTKKKKQCYDVFVPIAVRRLKALQESRFVYEEYFGPEGFDGGSVDIGDVRGFDGGGDKRRALIGDGGINLGGSSYGDGGGGSCGSGGGGGLRSVALCA